MKNKRVLSIILIVVLVLLCFTCVVVFADYKDDGELNLISQDNNTSFAYRLGNAFGTFFRDNKNPKDSGKVIAYVNRLPVYKNDVVERAQKMKILSEISGNTWTTNPVEYTFVNKYIEYYAKKNDITITDEELNQYVELMKSNSASNPSLDEYFKGLGIGREEFWNDVAPEYYRKHLLEGRVRSKISDKLVSENKELEKLFGEDLNKYVTEYCHDHMKVKIKDKKFVEQYDKNLE